jgi:hypothetical protein
MLTHSSHEELSTVGTALPTLPRRESSIFRGDEDHSVLDRQWAYDERTSSVRTKSG